MEQGRNKARHHRSWEQRKRGAAKSCGVKPSPPRHLLFWSRPNRRTPLKGGSLTYPTSSPCSCFPHCSLLPRDSLLAACHLSVLSLPSSSPKRIFLVGSPAGPTLQNQPVGELLHRSARNKNRNPCQFCISRIISYVAHLCVVLDFLLLWLFTVLCVFQINLLGFFTIKDVVSLKH